MKVLLRTAAFSNYSWTISASSLKMLMTLVTLKRWSHYTDLINRTDDTVRLNHSCIFRLKKIRFNSSVIQGLLGFPGSSVHFNEGFYNKSDT